MIMNMISGANDVIVTSYENREKNQIYGKNAFNMSKQLKIDHRIYF